MGRAVTMLKTLLCRSWTLHIVKKRGTNLPLAGAAPGWNHHWKDMVRLADKNPFNFRAHQRPRNDG